MHFFPLGLEQYSMDQIYFIASTWFDCEPKRPTLEYVNMLHIDNHAPEDFRVLAKMRGNPEFIKAFQCPLGSKMNPSDIKICDIWQTAKEVQQNQNEQVAENLSQNSKSSSSFIYANVFGVGGSLIAMIGLIFVFGSQKIRKPAQSAEEQMTLL